jgi:hypothetical protein
MRTSHAMVDAVRLFQIPWRRWRDEPYAPVAVALRVDDGAHAIDAIECESGGYDEEILTKAVLFSLTVSDDVEVQCRVIDAILEAYVAGRMAEMG